MDDFLRRGEPLVLTGGCPLVAHLVGRWDFDHLSNGFGSCDSLAVHYAPRETTVFSRMYGKGLGTGGVSNMSFQRFARTVREQHLVPHAPSAPLLRYYLQAPLVWREPATDGSEIHGPVATSQEKPLSSAPYGPEIEADMRGIGWKWLHAARDVAQCHPFDTCQLWAGHGGGSTPLHFDSLSNFLAQVKGRKQVLLFSPAQSWNVYPFPVGHPKDNFAMVDVEHPDLHRFPGLSRARALEAILEPGDVLWLPRFYWHYVHQLDAPSENLSLNFWVGRKGTEEFFRTVREAPLPSDAEVAQAAAAAAADFGRTHEDEAAGRQLDADDDALIGADAATGMACLHMARMVESAGAQALYRTLAPPAVACYSCMSQGGGTACPAADGEAWLQCASSPCSLTASSVARRCLVTGHKLMGGDEALGNRFLAALAAGAESGWPVHQEAATKATRLRRELMSVLGARCTNALLRAISRDGRLYPGLAPKVEGPIINSEKSQYTPREEAERLFAAAAAAAATTARE